ncbi:hypothetical protein BDP67DRAFT_417420, partial [Colletotrichum lupini]
KRFPKVISFNNTYNINYFKLPLLYIYNTTFGLINNKKLKSFRFFLISIY